MIAELAAGFACGLAVGVIGTRWYVLARMRRRARAEQQAIVPVAWLERKNGDNSAVPEPKARTWTS